MATALRFVSAFFSLAFHRFWNTVTWTLYQLTTRLTITGRECVPPGGPLIVVSNHMSLTEPPLISFSVRRRIQFLIKIEAYRHWFTGPFSRGYKSIPVHRGAASRGAIRQAVALLAQDKTIGMFPEGTRSKGSVRRAQLGAALLALDSGAPILPVAITGTQHIGTMRWFTRPRITVSIGSPFSLPVLEGPVNRTHLASLSDMIMVRVVDLLPPSYRGYYASKGPATKDARATQST